MRVVVGMLLGLGLTQVPSGDRVPASGGEILVTAVAHASLQIEYGGKVIHVDPVLRGADYSGTKPADLVLVTDIHADHLDPEGVAKVRKAGVPVVVPGEASAKIPDGTAMANGERKTLAGIAIEAIPMYNLGRGPSPGQLFHTKGRGNGYLLELGGKRVYIAGDTECVPEIRALEAIDVAFLPMNLPFTMTPTEAAECAKAFKPKVATRITIADRIRKCLRTPFATSRSRCACSSGMRPSRVLERLRNRRPPKPTLRHLKRASQ